MQIKCYDTCKSSTNFILSNQKQSYLAHSLFNKNLHKGFSPGKKAKWLLLTSKSVRCSDCGDIWSSLQYKNVPPHPGFA